MSLGSFLTGRSEAGELYMMGVASPDGRFEDDLKAVDEYVRTTARGRLSQYPASIAQIEEYERWRQTVGWYDMSIVPNDTWRTARAKLAAINTAQKSILPADTGVEPGAFITAPEDQTAQFLSTPVKLALGIGTALAVTLLAAIGLSKLSPMTVAKNILTKGN